MELPEKGLENMLVLALIVMIWTFLSITLELEVEGRWPWQRPLVSGLLRSQRDRSRKN